MQSFLNDLNQNYFFKLSFLSSLCQVMQKFCVQGTYFQDIEIYFSIKHSKTENRSSS
jgi:hypothetical protein